MAQADVLARKSLCSKAQVGVVITDINNKIVSEGYNGPPAGFEHGGLPCVNWCPRAIASAKGEPVDTVYNDCVACHAEPNAIAVGDRSRIEGGTIYITGAICFQCAKLVANSGVLTVVHRVTPEMAFRNPEHVEAFLIKCGLNVYRWDDDRSSASLCE